MRKLQSSLRLCSACQDYLLLPGASCQITSCSDYLFHSRLQVLVINQVGSISLQVPGASYQVGSISSSLHVLGGSSRDWRDMTTSEVL